MSDDLSDTQIRANLRSLFSESGVDPNRTAFLCANGIVRVLGEIVSARHNVPLRSTQIGDLEDSIRRSDGVARVHFHPQNWKRLPTGEWSVAPSGEDDD